MSDALNKSIQELVIANRILHAKGVVDGFGHVSVRHPERADRFLLSRNRAPALVVAEDILEFHLDGAPVLPTPPAVYLERFIHGCIYAARPDVGAVVHSHSQAMLPFGAVRGLSLRPISHMAGFLGAGAPCFEIRHIVGEASDLLIRDVQLGDALATALGDAAVVLMRGHGSTVVGRDVRQAVFHAIYAEWNAHIQTQALGLGEPVYMTVAEARAAAAANDGQIGRAWDYWCSQTDLN